MSTEIEDLTRRVAELENELRRRPAPSLPTGMHGWAADGEEEAAADDRPVSHAWLTWLEPRHRPRPRVPRLPFQVLFLGACAAAAGYADLEPIWIVAVLGAAWALVSLAEWAGARADRRRRVEGIAPPTAFAAGRDAGVRADPSWFAPPVEHTIVHGTAAPRVAADGATAVTRVRAPEAPSEVETTAERGQDG